MCSLFKLTIYNNKEYKEMTISCQHFLKNTMPILGIQKKISELSMNKTKYYK